jgi:hypothetical protein
MNRDPMPAVHGQGANESKPLEALPGGGRVCHCGGGGKKPPLVRRKIERKKARAREAAYEAVCAEEQCWDLAGKHARESAQRSGEAIGGVRDNYEAIVLGFMEARTLSVVLRNEIAEAPGDYIRKLEAWVHGYVVSCIRGVADHYNWALGGHAVDGEFIRALGEEYVRDREGLWKFLGAAFNRWRKDGEEHSVMRQRVLVHQSEGGAKEVALALERVGAAPESATVEQLHSACARVRQYRSRDGKAAKKRHRKV